MTASVREEAPEKVATWDEVRRTWVSCNGAGDVIAMSGDRADLERLGYRIVGGPEQTADADPMPKPPEAASAGDPVDLLPCPFCGGAAFLSRGQQVGTQDNGWRRVRCKVCNAASGGYNLGSLSQTIPAVVKGWNARAPR